MKILFWIIMILLFLYITFAFAPSLYAFFHTYAGREGENLDRIQDELAGTQYPPFLPQIIGGIRWYESLQDSLREVSTLSREGLRLAGYYLDCGSKRTAILFHGYHTTIANNFGVIAQDLKDMGFNLLFVDQRAFFKSEGKHCCFGLKEQYDVLSWIDFTDKTLGAEEILVFGVSMGGTTVAYSSDKIDNPKVKALVNDCGFTCVYDLQTLTGIRHHAPISIMMPHVRFFAKLFLGIDIRFSAENALKNSTRPVFFIHGTEDLAVPLSWEEKNYKACGSEKEQMLIPGVGHAVAYVASGEEGRRRLKEYLRKYFSVI